MARHRIGAASDPARLTAHRALQPHLIRPLAFALLGCRSPTHLSMAEERYPLCLPLDPLNQMRYVSQPALFVEK